MKFPNWHDRPEQFSPGEAANGKLDGHHFIQMADQFISLANKRNRKVDATEIQMVMLPNRKSSSNIWQASMRTCCAATLQIQTSDGAGDGQAV